MVSNLLNYLIRSDYLHETVVILDYDMQLYTKKGEKTSNFV